MSSQKKIYSIYHGRFPGERAATLFAAKEAESFADAGIETTLVVPRRLGRANVDPYDYFGVKKNFRLVYLPTIDLFQVPVLSRFAFPVSFLAFSLSVLVYLILRAKKADMIYSNESLPILLASFFFPRTMIAVHDFPERKRGYYRFLFERVMRILATNAWKKNEISHRFDVPGGKIEVIPNAVDIAEFDTSVSKEDARERLGLSPSRHIVVYTGHLYSWKGVDTLADAASTLPDIEFVFVGGRDDDLSRFRERHHGVPNITLVGFRPHSEIPLWQCAADALVLPNTAKEEISAHYTSPMKLFEYMASGRPIIASQIPSIEEIVSDDDVHFFVPDDPDSLAEAVSHALADGKGGSLKTKVAEYSWTNRTRRVLRSFAAARFVVL